MKTAWENSEGDSPGQESRSPGREREGSHIGGILRAD